MSHLTGPSKQGKTDGKPNIDINEDLSEYQTDFKDMMQFIATVSGKIIEGNYNRCDIPDDGKFDKDTLDTLVHHFTHIEKVIPDLREKYKGIKWIRDTFFGRILHSLAYSLQYPESPADEEGRLLSSEATLLRFIIALQARIGDLKSSPFTVACHVEVIEMIDPQSSAQSSTKIPAHYGHSAWKSRSKPTNTEAERVLGHLYRRALAFPLMGGKVPPSLIKTKDAYCSDQCAEIISLPYIMASVDAFLKGGSGRSVTITCLTMAIKDKDQLEFCDNCERLVNDYINTREGLKIIDLASKTKYTSHGSQVMEIDEIMALGLRVQATETR